MKQGEPVRTLAEIAKQKFTSVADRKEKSTTEGCGGREKGATAVIGGKGGKGVRFRETRQKFKVYILYGSDKLDIFEGRYYLHGL